MSLKELKGGIVKTLNTQKEATAKGLEIGFDDLSKQWLTLAEEGQRIARQQIILQTLVFEEMEQREETIKDAHKATLDWMFEEKETHFAELLEVEKGIYWVKGKVRLCLPHRRIPNSRINLTFEGGKRKAESPP